MKTRIPIAQWRGHPMFVRWQKLRVRRELCAAWQNDLDAFAAAVGSVPPDGSKKLARPDGSRPFGPDNFAWTKSPTVEGRKAYHRTYNQENYQRLRHTRFQSLYGLSLDEYDDILGWQGGGCAVCGRSASEPTRRGGQRHKHLAVDHCHETGEVRGLLCTDCNVAISLLGDDPNLMINAANYLRSHQRKKRRDAS